MSAGHGGGDMIQNIRETRLTDVTVKDTFWSPRLEINRKHSLIYQWEKYLEAGTIENFRIAAGISKGNRRGFFYTDSDLHKWADAASRVLASKKDLKLQKLLKEYISLVDGAQDDDGYLYTFNQVNFPGTRWVNLQIEHELYCMGHFIEAGIEYFQATGKKDLLVLVEKTARLICSEFLSRGPGEAPGHQEIELALLRLYGVTKNETYRETAEHFLYVRGRKRLFGFMLLREFFNHGARMKELSRHSGIDEAEGFDYTEAVGDKKPFLMGLRLNASFLSGRYHQQHKPVEKQKKPAGHAVRFTYLQTARTMAAGIAHDTEDLERQEALWEKLVSGWMYVTGGIGSLPLIEGFGRKYELNNRHAYCETCAAIGNIFWNHELFKVTGKSRYADLLEWQLYNGALAGVSAGGDAWFYSNPLDAYEKFERRPWFDTACCPSNISRLQASIGRYISSWKGDTLFINQYISMKEKATGQGHLVSVKSELPYGNRVRISVSAGNAHDCTVKLRIPSWSDGAVLIVNGLEVRYLGGRSETTFGLERFAAARYETLTVPKGKKYILNLELKMPVQTITAHPKVRSARGRVAITRGPLVYCLEGWRNHNLDHDGALILPSKISYREEGDGTGLITGRDKKGPDLFFTPWYNRGNKGSGWMQVWVKKA